MLVLAKFYSEQIAGDPVGFLPQNLVIDVIEHVELE